MTIGSATEIPLLLTNAPDPQNPEVAEMPDHLTLVHGRLPGDVYVRRPMHLPDSLHDEHEDGYECRPDEVPGIASASVDGKRRRELIGRRFRASRSTSSASAWRPGRSSPRTTLLLGLRPRRSCACWSWPW